MSENSSKKPDGLFTKLTSLFKSGPIIKRKIMAYDPTVALAPNKNDKTSAHMLFQRSTNVSYTEALAGTYQIADRVARYQDFNEMEYCLSGDTNVATTGGFKTLKELSEQYGLDKEFVVFSYDHNLRKLVAAKGRQARKTRTDSSYRVTLSNGKEVIGTGNHRLLLREGVFCKIEDLKVGDKLYPFQDKYINGTRSINTIKSSEVRSWVSEEDLIEKIVVNQKDCTRNPLTFGQIVEASNLCNFDINKICDVYDVSIESIENELKKYRFPSFQEFIKVYDIKIRKATSKDFPNVIRNFEKGKRVNYIAKKCNITMDYFLELIQDEGYTDFEDFVDNFYYHEVVKVEENGVIDLYDLTVDGYKNFATDSIISHNTPEIAAALDIYSDETCAQDEKGRTLHVFSNNQKIKKILEDLFYNTLNVEFSLRSWARSLCKYGDFFLYNDISQKYGVVNVFPIPVSEIERMENYDPEDPFAVKFRWIHRGNRFLENWEVTHMRMLGNDMFLPYGSAIIEPARRIWKQLTLIEDAMLVYRLVRAPERRVFYVDVGNLPAESVPTYVEQLRKSLKTNQVVDKSSGKVDLRYNPVSIEEDYFIPVRGADSGTKIDSLAGGQNTSAVEDVEYLQKKLFASLKIPRAYLGYDETLASKSTLAQEDIRFSRTINVVQRTIIAELNKLAIIHLFANGYDGDDLMDFVLHLSNPSTIAQIQKMELWKTKFELAATVPEGILSKTFIRKELLGLNQEQIEEIDKQRIEEKIRENEIETASEEEEPSEEEQMGDEEGGNELLGGEEGGMEAMGGEEGEESAADVLNSLNASKQASESYPIKALRDVVRQKYPFDTETIEEASEVSDTLKKVRRRSKRKKVKSGHPNMSNYVNPIKGNIAQNVFDIKSLTKISESDFNNEAKPQLSNALMNMLTKMNEKLLNIDTKKIITEN